MATGRWPADPASHSLPHSLPSCAQIGVCVCEPQRQGHLRLRRVVHSRSQSSQAECGSSSGRQRRRQRQRRCGGGGSGGWAGVRLCRRPAMHASVTYYLLFRTRPVLCTNHPMRALTHPNETTPVCPGCLQADISPARAPRTARIQPPPPAFILPAPLSLPSCCQLLCTHSYSPPRPFTVTKSQVWAEKAAASREGSRSCWHGCRWPWVATKAQLGVCVHLQTIHGLLLHGGQDGVTSCPLANAFS